MYALLRMQFAYTTDWTEKIFSDEKNSQLQLLPLSSLPSSLSYIARKNKYFNENDVAHSYQWNYWSLVNANYSTMYTRRFLLYTKYMVAAKKSVDRKSRTDVLNKKFTHPGFSFIKFLMRIKNGRGDWWRLSWISCFLKFFLRSCSASDIPFALGFRVW